MCLQWLVLSYNDIGPAGGEAIAKGLQVSHAYYSTVTDLICSLVHPWTVSSKSPIHSSMAGVILYLNFDHAHHRASSRLNTAQKILLKLLDLLKFAWSKYDAKKYKLGGNQKQIMVNTAFAYPIF